MTEDLSQDPLLTQVPEDNGKKFLDPVELHSKIGQGGMGTVYRGHHRNLGIDVAVKVLSPALARQDGCVPAGAGRRVVDFAPEQDRPPLRRVLQRETCFPDRRRLRHRRGCEHESEGPGE